MLHAVEYRPLARWLASLPLDVSRDAFLAQLATFRECESVYWQGLLVRMCELPADADWYACVRRLCELLCEENPRFVPVLFMEWALEGR